jgi:hypothetical protein
LNTIKATFADDASHAAVADVANSLSEGAKGDIRDLVTPLIPKTDDIVASVINPDAIFYYHRDGHQPYVPVFLPDGGMWFFFIIGATGDGNYSWSRAEVVPGGTDVFLYLKEKDGGNGAHPNDRVTVIAFRIGK